MSITKFGEIHADRGMDVGDKDATTATRSWRVVTNSRTDREKAILTYGLANAILPDRYTPHPDSPALVCLKLSAKQQSDSPLHWIVTASYSTRPTKESEREKEQQENPLLRPAKRTWATRWYKKVVDRDRSGNAILNSAGDPFDPPPERDVSHWCINISKNVDEVPSFVIDLDQPINDDDITIGGLEFAAETLKLVDMQISELQRENNVDFYVLSYVLEYDRETWQLRPLDCGFYENNPTLTGGTTRQRIKDAQQKDCVTPWPLNKLGVSIRAPTPANAQFMEYDVYELLDFGELPGIED